MPSLQIRGLPLVNDAYPAFGLPGGRQLAIQGAWVFCRCANPPRAIASTDKFRVAVNRAGSVASVPAAAPPFFATPQTANTQDPLIPASYKESEQKSTLPDDPVLICPNYTNEQFSKKIMELCRILEDRMKTRLTEIRRWTARDQRSVVTWFGVADATTRQTLLTGISEMLRVTQSLKPENFVRWSETALTHVGCAPGRPRGETRQAVAAVCKPDTKTHTIAITLLFCEMRDDWDRGDSRLLTLAHEVSHFLDTMDTNDDYYGVWNSIALAKIKSPKCISIADSVAGYIVIHSDFPDGFGNFIDDSKR